jgi:hypothetical protein
VLRFVAGFGGGRKQLKEKKQGGKKVGGCVDCEVSYW